MSTNLPLPVQLARLLLDISQLIRSVFGSRITDLPLSEPQWRVIGYIGRSEGLSQTELAHLLGISRAPLGEYIDRMESTGLVIRCPDKEDRRCKRIYLSDTGRSLHQQLVERFQQLEQQLQAGMTKQLWNETHHTLLNYADELVDDQVQAALQQVRRDNSLHLAAITAHHLRKQIRSVLTKHQLSRQQWLVLAELQTPSSINQAQLVTNTGLAKAALGKLVAELESRHLVHRKTDQHDRRARRLTLSQAGADTLARLYRELAKLPPGECPNASFNNLPLGLTALRQQLLDQQVEYKQNHA
jgi:MarR family transcriptional regulator for hemolysin